MKIFLLGAFSAGFVMPALAEDVSQAIPAASPAPATTSNTPLPVTPSPVTTLVATPKPVATTGASLAANSELWLSANQEINSKKIKQGAKFDMTVARDVVLGDYVVIPRGSKGRGQITYRTGKGAFGKSAKMEFDIQEVEVGGKFIPLTGHYRIEGQGNTGATVGAAVAVGVFSVFVTGRSAVIPQGYEYKAFTVNPIPIVLAEPVALPTASVASPVAISQN